MQASREIASREIGVLSISSNSYEQESAGSQKPWHISVHLPSSFALFPRVLGWVLGASALGWRATAWGTAAPGARAGYFRAAPLATLDEEEPIVTVGEGLCRIEASNK